jgi:nitrate/nitrite transport system substrate-binding protein
LGDYDYGDGRKTKDENYMIFHSRNCNFPEPKFAKWWLTQFRRWGMVDAAPDYEGVAKKVMRADLYAAALKELGVDAGGPSTATETLFDGKVFDPSEPEKYATSFDVHSMKT